MILDINFKRKLCPVVKGIGDEFEGVVTLAMLSEAASIESFSDLQNVAFKDNVLKLGAHPSNSRDGKTANVRGILTESYFATL